MDFEGAPKKQATRCGWDYEPQRVACFFGAPLKFMKRPYFSYFYSFIGLSKRWAGVTVEKNTHFHCFFSIFRPPLFLVEKILRAALLVHGCGRG